MQASKLIRLLTLNLMIILLSCGLAQTAAAAIPEQVGTLTQVEGQVKLFSNPSKTLPNDDGDSRPRALFEGEYFRVQDARPGDRIEHGNILRTALGAKARVVYDNGDQFHLGPGTSYRIFWNQNDPKNAKKPETNVNLLYGKLRGIIAKGGPRSRLKVKTRAATMGVRGTEFFIAESGEDGETEISLIRGSVEVIPTILTQTKAAGQPAPAPTPVELKSGFSATITSVLAKAQEIVSPAPVEIRKTTQEDLIAIQKTSEITKTSPPDSLAQPQLAAQIEALEKKALQTSLTDIKTHDPELFARIQKAPALKSSDDVQSMTVKALMETAPKAPPKRKPFKSELDDLERGAYEKYFKIVE